MPIAPLKRVSYLITDEGADMETIEKISAMGIKVLIAPIRS